MSDMPNTPFKADELTAMRASTPERYSVQSRAENAPFAPVSDVTGAGMFWIQLGQRLNEEPQYNPIYPHWRDVYLQQFARSEPMLASAVYSMATRISGLNYTLNGPPRAKKYAQELLTRPGLGDTLSTLVQKTVSDLHTADNGAFWELWRAGSPLSDAGNRPVLGFAHLDSRQCWRSYDPEYPVWYTNPITHQIRKIHRSRVVFTSDNPQGTEVGRNIGFCATSRVLMMARVFRSMEVFLDEKLSGRFTRAIGAASGITPKQLKDALIQNNDVADAKGYVVYKDIPFLVSPNMEKGSEIKLMIQDLASIPDGFVFKDDADVYAYILAFCFGVDAREFWPSTTTGATKADATVQNMKARGRGIGNDIEMVEGMIRAALPESVTYEYDYTDDEQDKLAADIHKVRADTHKVYVDMGAIRPEEARALGIAEGALDGDVLDNLALPVNSDDNPDTPQADGASDTTPDGQQPADANNQDGQKPTTTPKVLKTYSGYRREIRQLTRGLWTGDFSTFDFVDGMVSAINRQFDLAWTEGARSQGVEPDERTQEETDKLNEAINTEISYLTNFADAINANSRANGGALQPLLDRADLWAAAYDRIVLLAQSIAGADVKMKWKRDQSKVGCVDCIQYDGKIYRKSEWASVGVYPRCPQLACTGINCGCDWEPTTERKTRGTPPPLIGSKIMYFGGATHGLSA